MSSDKDSDEAVRASFEAHGQGQVFAFWESLTADERASLLADARAVDLDQVARMFEAVQAEGKAAAAEPVGVFEQVADLDRAPADQRKAWSQAGLDAIGRGEVALLLVAGGQGTRLGFHLPKGLYDIGLPSGKTLLQLQAERVRKLQELAGGKGRVLWLVMTSHFTHADTVRFFEEKNFFGLNETDVLFFSQGTLPCLTPDGKIMLSSRHSIAKAPNGNGGVYDGLRTSGALETMRKRGIKYMHLYCVDNVLVKVADPVFVGFCIDKGADCCNKVVRKNAPNEPVGVMCTRGGNPSVIEYSEITTEMSEAVDAKTGELQYGAGNIANHFFTFEFLEQVCARSTELPFHMARKKIPTVDAATGEPVRPEAPNGLKLEMFVFDVFRWARNMWAFAVPRAGEFSPLKNAPGSAKDSPDTCRAHVSAYHTQLAEACGATVTGPDDTVFEISPLVSYDGEGLDEHVRGKTFEKPFELH